MTEVTPIQPQQPGCIDKIFGGRGSLNELMSYEPVGRTAQATPGLLKTHIKTVSDDEIAVAR